MQLPSAGCGGGGGSAPLLGPPAAVGPGGPPATAGAPAEPAAEAAAEDRALGSREGGSAAAAVATGIFEHVEGGTEAVVAASELPSFGIGGGATGTRPWGARVQDCIQSERQRWLHVRSDYNSLEVLHRFPTLLVLAAWHTYGAWLAFCAVICMAGNGFLSWYIGWYQLVPSSCAAPSTCTQAFPYGLFFAIFLRSWLLVAVTSELCRFCYLLFQDIWAKDAFGYYRRALCGCAPVDMQQREDRGHWPTLQPWQRKLDCFCQLAIYASFDVLPFIWGAVAFMRDGVWQAQVTLFQVLLSVALMHTSLFFVAWQLADVASKCRAFRDAWRGDHPRAGVVARTPSPHFERAEPEPVREPADPEPDEPGGDLAADGGWRRWRRWLGQLRGRMALQQTLAPRPNPPPAAPEAPPQPMATRTVASLAFEELQRAPAAVGQEGDALAAEELNVCVPLCGWLDVLGWELLFVAALVSCVLAALWAAIVLQTVLWMALCLLGGLVVLFWRCRWAMKKEFTNRCRLQMWGEEHCSLKRWDRWSVHTSFGIVLIFQGFLFGYAQQWSGFAVCAVMLLAVWLREMVLDCERNNGWWIGVMEGLGIWLFISLLNLFFDGIDSCWKTVLLSFLHQCGLQRSRPFGSRLVKVVFTLMYAMLILIVGATVLSVKPSETSKSSTWSAFLKKDGNASDNFTVPYQDVRGQGLACEARFSSGLAGVSFSLGDFGLFSALPYESNETMARVLHHYFPGWRILHSRVVGKMSSGVEGDWTTFYEYSDSQNTTSVFAIRGTDTTLDVLTDINIWLTAALLQGFMMLGPEMLTSISQAVSFWSVIVRGEVNPRDHFRELSEYVANRTREEGARRFYITGHSLGGGLAKLVAAQQEIQAITFAAPGVAHTRYTVFGTSDNNGSLTLGKRAVTVQPKHDLVSRIDGQVGTVVPTACEKDPLTCHSIYAAGICPIFMLCGSMRDHDNGQLELPCEQCESMCK